MSAAPSSPALPPPPKARPPTALAATAARVPKTSRAEQMRSSRRPSLVRVRVRVRVRVS